MRDLLLGNEAIAFGALDAGVRIAASYPGTPATEIGETLARMGKGRGTYFEWSVNEKVALEVALGASLHGLRAMASMKNLGLNVASDTLNVAAINGVGGGLLVVSADDPGAHSSTSEQDGRWHARMACLPLLEPSCPQEAYDLARTAFDLSEKFCVPVIMRTTTRLAHSHGIVERREPYASQSRGSMSPHLSFRLSDKIWNKVESTRRLHSTIEKVEDYFCTALNDAEESPSRWGVVCSGVPYNYAFEARTLLGLEGQVSLFKLATTFPVPAKSAKKFCEGKEAVLVLEELSPFVEAQLRTVTTNIVGKMDGYLPLEGELAPDEVARAIARMCGTAIPHDGEREEIRTEASRLSVRRTLALCPGCAYRDVWYVLSRLETGPVSFSGDIGCYTLLTFPPHKLFDTVYAMGSSVGVACGGYRSSPGERQIALMGDSTFFHSGIPGLINAVYNRARLVLVILDNGTTAMTGLEPHPGTGVTAQGDTVRKILPEEVARGCGVEAVFVVSPFHLNRFEAAMREALRTEGVSLVVARHPCVLKEVGERRRRGERLAPYWISEECRECEVCARYGCPAMVFVGSRPRIVDELCVGCGVCAYLCPFSAVQTRR